MHTDRFVKYRKASKIFTVIFYFSVLKFIVNNYPVEVFGASFSPLKKNLTLQVIVINTYPYINRELNWHLSQFWSGLSLHICIVRLSNFIFVSIKRRTCVADVNGRREKSFCGAKKSPNNRIKNKTLYHHISGFSFQATEK